MDLIGGPTLADSGVNHWMSRHNRSNKLDSGRCCRFISSSGSTTEPSWSARTRSSAT